MLKKNRNKNSRFWFIQLTLVFMLLSGIILAATLGKYPVSPLESLQIIGEFILGRASSASTMTQNVVLGLRVPRIFASVLVGAVLSISGAAYQGIFKNPLVSPDFLGVSSGASIGAAIAILLSLSSFYISIFAFGFGLLAVLITVTIPAIMGNRSNIMLVLSGIIVGTAMSSVLGFIKFIADPYTQLASITYWTMGSFAYITLADLAAILPILLIPTIILILIAWWIDVLSMGEDEAKTLGVRVGLIRGIAIVCSTLLTAGSVALAGTISWVGLIIPHFGRMLVGPSHRKLLPLCGLLGGVFMLLVDTLTRTLGTVEMPVSIITGLLGAPVFVWLLFRQRRNI
jgi:iron complex transport system permease protein